MNALSLKCTSYKNEILLSENGAAQCYKAYSMHDPVKGWTYIVDRGMRNAFKI